MHFLQSRCEVLKVAYPEGHSEGVESAVLEGEGFPVGLHELDPAVLFGPGHLGPPDVEHAGGDVNSDDLQFRGLACRLDGEVRRAGGHVQDLFRPF